MRRLGPSIVGLGLAGGLLSLPVQAHKTEVSGDVAGTWHLEPNHSPKAGEPARVWVALTQPGGKMIPLELCDCRLAIYGAGEGDPAPTLEPTLEAISADPYQGIPGADVIFPDIGEYRLVLTGRPRDEATFSPFELSYTTVVAAGRADSAESFTPMAEAASDGTQLAPAQPEVDLSAETSVAQSLSGPTAIVKPWAIGGGLGGLAVLVILVVLRLRPSV